MAQCHDYAGRLARELSTYGFTIFPDPPHTTAFRLYAPHPADEMLSRTLALAETDQLALPSRWSEARVPGWAFTEITATPPLLDSFPDPRTAAALLGRLLDG